MNIDKLREDLMIDEGTKNEIYLDHLQIPSFGIGHMVTEWDEEVMLILANMMFNMGRPRLSGFKKLNAAIKDRDWSEAAIQMEDSRWHKQVTNRADRLIERMNKVSN